MRSMLLEQVGYALSGEGISHLLQRVTNLAGHSLLRWEERILPRPWRPGRRLRGA